MDVRTSPDTVLGANDAMLVDLFRAVVWPVSGDPTRAGGDRA
jgi:hypothetical protein